MAATLDVDKLFVSKIVQEHDLTQVVDVVPTHFIFNETYRDAYTYIRQYYSEHGTVPTVRVMTADCPDARLTNVSEPWEDIIKRVQTKYLAGVIERGLEDVADAYSNGNIEEAVNFLGVTVAKIHTAVPSNRDVDVTKNGEERLARYQERANNPGTMVGVPSGYPTIDKATQGFQPGQLITLTGLTKASKSAIAMTFGMAAQSYGKRVMYCTYEMTVEEQTNRLDAYRAGFNDNKLNSGDITAEEWKRLQEAIHLTENLPLFMFAEDTMTVTAIGAKMDMNDVDVVIVDGVYMMDDEQGEASGSPQALTNIVKGLKSLAMRRKVTIIAVTQSTPARTKGETLNNDSIMGSRSFGQYSNVVIGLERMEDRNMRKLRILFSRSCSPRDVVLEVNFDTGTFREMPDYDLEDDSGDPYDDEAYSEYK